MSGSKICLCLSCSTIKENLLVIEKYRNWIDMVELRVDYLTKDERLYIRRFPELAGLPCILTIRRRIDGGKFTEGEAARTTLFARGLAFADQDASKNFAYIDLEEDFHVPCLQDAALAFDTKIIRSYHNMHHTIDNLAEKMETLRMTGYEIPKVAVMAHSLSDVTNLYRQVQEVKKQNKGDHIVLAMGPYGLASRVLAQRFGSLLSYTSPQETLFNYYDIGHIDPITLQEVYNYKTIDDATALFGITGYPLTTTGSPKIHNQGYKNHGINASYLPLKAEKIEEAIEFADVLGISGLSVTIPHKEKVIDHLQSMTEVTGEIGACNTIVKKDGEWKGYNTDVYGFSKSLLEFVGTKNLSRMKVAILGAGGAARAAAHVVHSLRGKACVFNRTVFKARSLAEYYNFRWASLDYESLDILEHYSDLIIQTTSVGLGVSQEEMQKEEHDPISFYTFVGRELVYDMVYSPEKTPLLLRAEKAGCRIENGKKMLEYQAEAQFSLFTGEKYE
jgi:3-dehydroquinate dehydratase/shikimate dehydrogenase